MAYPEMNLIRLLTLPTAVDGWSYKRTAISLFLSYREFKVREHFTRDGGPADLARLLRDMYVIDRTADL